jgi:hypothetical protein
MGFFEDYFKDTDFDQSNDTGEVAVLCPFPHFNGKVQYYESVPSAHINVEKRVYHCKVCGAQHSEPSFMKETYGIEYADAIKLLKHLEAKTINVRWNTAKHNLKTEPAAKQILDHIKIPMATADELELGYEGNGIAFPVYVFGSIVDVRTYKPGGSPKVKSRIGASSGYLIPDVSKMRNQEEVLICAGEKDMAIARSLGLNAYTITGGEGRLPTRFGYAFKNKKVYILYDNDDAGRNGAKKLGSFIYEHGGKPYVVFGHHKVATEKGEDLWDYLVKYQKTKEDLLEIIYSTDMMSEEDLKEERSKEYPEMLLEYAGLPQNRGRYITSLVQVTAVYDSTFGIPNVLEFEKVSADGRPSGNILPMGHKGLYTITQDNSEDILYLMDSGLKEDQVNKNIRRLMNLPLKEEGVVIRALSHASIYKSTVVDYSEAKPTEFDIYTFQPLENGRKYRITYKTVQHPLRQQELVLIAKDVVPVDNILQDFKITTAVKNSLSVFKQRQDESVEDAMDRLYEYDKGYIGGEANKNITQTVDLVYNSPLHIKVGKQIIRGAIDAFMVGETRTGKSKAAKIKREQYDLGSIINLKTTTVQGLVGGTNKATNKTKIGLLPREHKNLVVLEEFSSMNDNAFIKAMTEIRSSGRVRIVRVDSDLQVPCQLRMLTISNPKPTQGGSDKPLHSYPNGISVITELIPTPEDIARYDFFTLVPEPENYISFLEEDFEKVPLESYRNRVRWVWTRKPQDIVMTVDVQKYLWQISEELNNKYNTHVRLFGTEAWMKLARIAVATAGILISTTPEFDKIVVTKEHIDWAKNFFIRLYDNPVFKLAQFVIEQRKYSDVDKNLVKELQDMYVHHATLFNFLETTSGVTRATLRDISGMNNEEFSILLNEMARLYLFKWSSGSLIPSERFRKGLTLINRNVKVEKGGDSVV